MRVVWAREIYTGRQAETEKVKWSLGERDTMRRGELKREKGEVEREKIIV